MVTKIEKYLACDGTEFSSELEATNHESYLGVKNDISDLVAESMSTSEYYDSDARKDVMDRDEVVEWVMKNRNQLLEILK